MKIAIVGGLGYIGTELQKLYEDTEHEVVIIDKDKDPVKILNSPYKVMTYDIIKDKLDFSSYDIVYNLAGITLTYSTDKKAVMDTNYKGAINVAKTSQRYIFVSTNNIFGGYDKQLKDVKEDFKPKPIGLYANSKYETEKWLKENHGNYIICRFGSCFGYNRGMKWSPVLNHFMLNSIRGQPITLDNGRDNIRPFVNVKDAARALFFLAHKEDIKNDTFHVVGGNESLKTLANLIRGWNSTTNVKEIDKDVWFNGYEINSNKIRKLGFTFNHTLNEAFQEFMKRK